jgi:hypothetical protein
MRSFRLWALVTAFTVTIAALAVVVKVVNEPTMPFSKRVALLERCVVDPWEPGETLAGAVPFEYGVSHTIKRVECATKTMAGFSSVEEMKASNELLFQLNETDENARLSCHDMAHEFGRWAYRDLGDDALIGGLGECGYGYYHGFMQSSMEVEEPAERIEALRSFCVEEGVRTNGGKGMNISAYIFCSHGVGHSIGGVIESKEEGAQLCNTMLLDRPAEKEYLDGHQRMERVIWPDTECFSGVLNQLWLDNNDRNEGFTSVAETIDQCKGLEDHYQLRCVSYGLHYSRIPVIDMIEQCPGTPAGELRNGCWAGIGYRGSDIVFDIERDPNPFPVLAGLTPEQVTGDAARTGAFLQRLCGGENLYFCAERFILETTQRTQQPDAMYAACQGLTDNLQRYRCEQAVVSVAAMHGGLSETEQLSKEEAEANLQIVRDRVRAEKAQNAG